MSIHEGHRDRLRKRFREEGLEAFTDIQALELLLFYCIPRKDTNPIAHELLHRFGTLAGVLEAPAAELKKVPGIGDVGADLLTMMLPLFRFYRVSKQNKLEIIHDVRNYGQILMDQLADKRNEEVYLLCMDAKCKMLSCKKVGEGSVNSAAVPIRRIVEMALAVNATSVVLAHNHPSGIAVPSEDDIRTTYRLAIALGAVDIQLVDHIVVADDDYVSMVQSQYYDPRDALMPV